MHAWQVGSFSWRWISRLVLPLWAAAAWAEGTNQLRPWLDYRTIMWISDTAYKQPAKVPLFFQRLRELGINTAMVHGDGDPQPLLDNRFPYYVENLVNRGLCLKWNSKVRDWDKFVSEWAKSGRPDSALVRDYCLDDPQWRNWARGEVQHLVRKNREHDPVAYDLRDELSTTISANPFDYDLSPGTALVAGQARARPDLHPLFTAEHPSGLAAGIHRGRLDVAPAVFQLRGGAQSPGARA